MIKRGKLILAKSGVDLVFVLGHPTYYPRYGFNPASGLGFEPPFFIPKERLKAWMVQELSPGIIGKYSGKVKCCDTLQQPQYWGG